MFSSTGAEAARFDQWSQGQQTLYLRGASQWKPVGKLADDP